MGKLRYVVAVDGGGSTVRAAIVDESLNALAQVVGGAVNPNTAGKHTAALELRRVIDAVIAQSRVARAQIAAIGAGVAGTAQPLMAAWLRETLADILPGARIISVPDYEIALIGANGKHHGVLILAGTGSLVYAAHHNHERILLGGWGYLLGDEGSGAWIGLEALRAMARMIDGYRDSGTLLYMPVMQQLGLQHPRDLIDWAYNGVAAQKMASLAPLVLSMAHEDEIARRIIDQGANALANMAHAARQSVELYPPEVEYAFAGGLLTQPNPLSDRLCARLGLKAIPQAQHTPLIGAAIMVFNALNNV